MLCWIVAAAARAIDGRRRDPRPGRVRTGDDMSDTHDADYDEHARMWHLFTRLVTIGVGVAVSVLVLMAITLL